MWFIRIKSIKRSMIRHVLYNFLQIFEIVYKIISIWNCFEYPMKNLTLHSPPLFSLTPPSSWCRTIPAKVRQQAKEPIVMLQKKQLCTLIPWWSFSLVFSKEQKTTNKGLWSDTTCIYTSSIVSINQRVFYILISPEVSEH